MFNLEDAEICSRLIRQETLKITRLFLWKYTGEYTVGRAVILTSIYILMNNDFVLDGKVQ